MAGPGGGPSRRSHTKSRKGCKTCKRRHIRCDETFPQCRNCTKHQVRCDYMDSPAAGDNELRMSQQANLLWTPEIEKTVQNWSTTGQFPFPDLHVFPQPQWTTVSKTELRLIYHLASICNDLQVNRTSKLTIWTELMPKFLGTSATSPFVMHAILAFAANHLAWISQSQETRNIAFHHGGLALKGLHEAIGTFSKANADAVLAASLLLTWQATDWRNWTSLMQSTKTIINAMQAWKEESTFHDYLTNQAPLFAVPFNTEPGVPASPETRRAHIAALQRIQDALQRLQPYLPASDQESKWAEQLNGYIHRLSTSTAPQTPEEQFGQLYALRKWLFWVPVTLLSARKGDVWTLLVLAHFYAAALSLEPAFPAIGAAFLANLAVQPLEEIDRIMNTISSSPHYHYQTASVMMQYPRDTLNTYHATQDWARSQGQQSPSGVQNVQQYGLQSLNIELGNHFAEFGYNQSLSPAFPPSPHAPSPMHPNPSSMAGPRSPYLEVPRSTMETYSYASGGSPYSTPLSSPGAPPTPGSFNIKHDDGHSASAAAASSMYSFAVPHYGYSTSMSMGMGAPGGTAPPLQSPLPPPPLQQEAQQSLLPPQEQPHQHRQQQQQQQQHPPLPMPSIPQIQLTDPEFKGKARADGGPQDT